MALLADYAITPDVFDVTRYSGEDACGLGLDRIREPMLTAGLVRDLRDGEWRALFRQSARPWHRRAKEIVKKLARDGRLIRFPAEGPPPNSDRDWCAEALASHARSPLSGGVIVTRHLKDAYADEKAVERIDRLARATWWTGGDPSVRLRRSLEDYRQHLDLVLRHANSLQFIDPHLDPTKSRYEDFVKLLRLTAHRAPAPLIEIHRVGYEGSGRHRRPLNLVDLEKAFRHVLSEDPDASQLAVRVFVWDHFHDRYLISNLAGIMLPNGFDTTSNSKDCTTWTRLGREARDDVQREFDPASRRHKLRAQFKVP